MISYPTDEEGGIDAARTKLSLVREYYKNPSVQETIGRLAGDVRSWLEENEETTDYFGNAIREKARGGLPSITHKMRTASTCAGRDLANGFTGTACVAC